MKKNYKTLSVVMSLTALFSLNLNAQFNGLYTINSAAPASATNFTTFSTFASSINAVGVSGPVTVNVAAGSGPYVEQVEFAVIAGVSATNSITINGNSNTLTFNATAAARHTLKLSGTDFMTVNSLTVVGSSATDALVVHLWNNADNNRFNNCRMETTLNGTGYETVPVSVSGTSNSGSSYGNAGNNNIFDGCVTSGGYFSVIFYGGSPQAANNQVINCSINDFYYYGFQSTYTSNTIFRNNTIQRLNRTTLSTANAITLDYMTYAATIEKNKIRRLFDAAPASGNSCYGVIIWSSAIQGSVNVISNNLISDITSNGSIYGIYDGGNQYNDILHNTIVMDNVVSTGGTIYGISSSGSMSQIKNNLVSINRTGNGTKYCVYISGNVQCNNNILFNNSPAGNNYIGGNGSTDYTTLATWQSGTSYDMNSVSGNPGFVNPLTYNYTPGLLALNNVGTPGLGISTDINGLSRNAPAPDAGAFEFFNQPCVNVPGTNTVIAPAGIVCPSALNLLTVANGYSVNGITYTWKSSANLVGPYTAIAGASLSTYITTTLTPGTNTFYLVEFACSFGGSTLTSVAGSIQVAGTTTNSVPYFEGFEGIGQNNNLPNCSWTRSNTNRTRTMTQSIGFRTPRTGTNYAIFDEDASEHTNLTYQFFTNGIQMYAGVTYSAAVWYKTSGSAAWNGPRILINNTQSTAGSTVIASVYNPNNSSYAQLSNTFAVAASGIYYIGIEAEDNHYHERMVWDDLAITIPCSLPANAAAIAVTGATAACAGQPLVLSASGVNSYTWSTGPNTSAITVTPSFNGSYTVTGTNSITGCQATVVKPIIVNQLPLVSITALKQQVCLGESVTLIATSANSYTWSGNGSNSAVITVTPTQNAATYSVVGTNVFGCTAQAVQQITVIPLPVLAVSGNTLICQGSSASLTATGANTYLWTSNLVYAGASVALAPAITTAYVLEGTDSNGCKGTKSVTVAVDPCTGIAGISTSSGVVSVYPNPNSGVFTVALDNGLNKTIEVVDVMGRVVLVNTTSYDLAEVNISALTNGVYYVKVKSESISEVIKIVKH